MALGVARVFSLFKSASQRSAEAVQTHINALKGVDRRGLGGVALCCSQFRLAELSHMYQQAAPDTYAKCVALYYRPLVVELPFVQTYIEKLEQSLLKVERLRLRSAHNPVAQGLFGLQGAAGQTWRNTWLGCVHADVRYLSQEMWKLISVGFPLVEEVALSLMQDPYYAAIPREIELFEYAIRDNGDGPDYEKIPEGFEP